MRRESPAKAVADAREAPRSLRTDFHRRNTAQHCASMTAQIPIPQPRWKQASLKKVSARATHAGVAEPQAAEAVRLFADTLDREFRRECARDRCRELDP